MALSTNCWFLVCCCNTFKVINRPEKEDIEAELTSTRQNQKLLSVLSRKSAEQFQQFLAALDKTDQHHITNKLTGRACHNGDIICEHLSKMKLNYNFGINPLILRTIEPSMFVFVCSH